MDQPEFDYAVEADGVATIRLNRPAKLNALTDRMALELLPAACRAATADPDIRAVVITGTGRAFCAGADVDDRLGALAEGSPAAIDSIGLFAHAVWAIPKPTVARINGLAVGAGLSLAAAADFRLAADTVEFAAGFGRLGLVPDGGLTYTLPQLVGPSMARRLLLLGRRLSAADAYECGLLDWVGPADDLDAAVADVTRALTRGAAPALTATKAALRPTPQASFEHHLELERAAQRDCLRTAEHREGVAAFRERREPDFVSCARPPART